MFSLTFRAFVMFVTFLLFQSNLYIVLACKKGPKNSIHRYLLRQNALNKKPQTPSCILHALWCVIGLHPS